MFVFGLGKRITVIILFILYEVIQNLSWVTLNGGDNLLRFVLFYYIFIDSYSRYSFKPIRYRSENQKEISNFFSNLAGYSICFHLCLVYFITAIHKIHADVWFNGIATYYILGSERFQGTPLNYLIAKNGFLVTISTYFTILIELSYPFLVWFKTTRNLMLTGVILLHIGIAIFMMLYDFQILFILLQGFFIKNSEWSNAKIFINKSVEVLKLKISKKWG